MPSSNRTNFSTIHHHRRIGDPTIVLGKRCVICDLTMTSASVKYYDGTIGEHVPYALLDTDTDIYAQEPPKPTPYRRLTDWALSARVTAYTILVLVLLAVFGAVLSVIQNSPPPR